ncbi:MAG: signal peptidase [Akkermansiaceae bacterium]|nr:signal peptidase [Akkermansiaceae bacterium]
MFTPKWKKEAKLLHKGAKKFLNYKRDLLKQDRIDEIESRRADLLAAIKADDKAKAEEAGKQLRNTCEKALPMFPAQAWWEEQVEVIWVALVVALGLRAYVLQPFRIPTGSMQPTLNGIIVNNHRSDPDYKEPWFGQRWAEGLLRGRSYQNIVATSEAHMDHVEDRSWFLFTRTAVVMSDKSEIIIPAARNEAAQPFYEGDRRIQFKAGQPILRGWIDTGDLVLVDKISYNFRTPKRGEVMVFDTRNLNTDGDAPGSMNDQKAADHYIKRLCAVPGDTVQIRNPDVIINGKVASEWQMQRVADAKGLYAPPPGATPGYSSVAARYGPHSEGSSFLNSPNKVVTLADKDAARGMREYLALGDNTYNSLDSRYWGTVKEYNVVGPGLFALWPITTGHWGFIK